MSKIEVRDICLWPQHIQGKPELQRRLLELREDELIVLRLGRYSSTWKKMRQSANPTPTTGLRAACDATRDWWKTVYPSRKGEWLTIEEVKE